MPEESYKKTTKDTCKIDWVIKSNGWDTKYNLVSTWECEEPIFKKVWFEKEFTPYPHFMVYNFEAILALLKEHPTDDLRYLSRHIPISVAIHDTLTKEPVYLVDENPKYLIEQIIEVLTGKQEAIAAGFLEQHPYPSDFQMLPGEVKEQRGQWVNQVRVIGFNSSKYHINMMEYFVEEISYNNDECNEDVFVAKQENDHMFLTTPKFKLFKLGRCECKKAAVYELLRTGMVGRPAQVFTRYLEKGITPIRSHVYREKSKLTKGVTIYK